MLFRYVILRAHSTKGLTVGHGSPNPARRWPVETHAQHISNLTVARLITGIFMLSVMYDWPVRPSIQLNTSYTPEGVRSQCDQISSQYVLPPDKRKLQLNRPFIGPYTLPHCCPHAGSCPSAN